VHAEDFVVGGLVSDDGRHGKVFEHVIQLLEDTLRVADVFAKSSCALLT
jgi:hypothetical protein